jgi:hypothetical protein
MAKSTKRQALTDVLKRFLAGPEESGEPYWAIVGVTAAGEVTGDLWGDRPRTVTVFKTRQLAADALKVAGQPSPEPPARMKRWEIHGLSSEAVQWLESEPSLQPYLATAIHDGRLVAHPLSDTKGY